MKLGFASYPVLGTLSRLLAGKFRLVVEYLLLALVVIAAASCITLWVETREQRHEIGQLRTRVVNNEIMNATQASTIDGLLAARRKDAEVTAGLLRDFAAISRLDKATQRKLRELERRNASVRDYLDQPIPADLGCLLDGSCKASADSDEGGAGSPAAGAAGAVLGTKGRAAGDNSRPR